MLNINILPQEVRDRLELNEHSDSTFSRVIDYDYTDIMFNTVDERANTEIEHSYIATFYGMQGSGKSYASLYLAASLSKDFSVDNIFFGYNDAVKNRRKFTKNSSIMVDEQMQAYGVDSNRVTILLNALKEQLRKKSVHMVYCSPTLKEEYHTSMYVLETLFIDKEAEECYCAYKTNKLQCLGYVVIPHPKKLLSKDFIKAYEEKKDAHLANLTEQSVDDILEQAQEIMNNEMFKNAEALYLESRGYIPNKMVTQLVNSICPEFHGSVITYEIADRIKMLKEISGEWKIAKGG